MAWIKTAARYMPNWMQTSDAPRVWRRSALVFLRDGVLAGIVWGAVIANTAGLPTDEYRALREQLGINREAMKKAAKDKAEWCSKHPETFMCRPTKEAQGKPDFDQMK